MLRRLNFELSRRSKIPKPQTKEGRGRRRRVMADLENLLLEAAGRTGGPGRNKHSRPPPSRRRRDDSYFDDGSDSKDDDDSDGDDPGYSGRKPSGSQVPLKKRLDTHDKDDDCDSRDDDCDYDDDEDRHAGSGDDSDVGSDLYKDDRDREELANMSKLQREFVLSKRATKKDDKRLQEAVRARQGGKKSDIMKETPPSVRVRSRYADKLAAKDDALNELRNKRRNKQDPEGHCKLRDSGRGGLGARGGSPVRWRSILTAVSPSSSSQSDSQSGSHIRDDGSTRDGDLGDSDDDRHGTGKEVPTFEEIKSITIRRSKLAKWFMEPFFEELIVGCFVRVGIGMSRSGQSIYRLCMVKNVDATDPNKQYKLENRTTYKYLNCIWGNESSAARW
ncbi:PREDICTED: protein RTF1 homolog [Nelumbo nucifera]|uniref:Protein RTF1 homolog n=1 Tax=Nelumbo nucifera TaxID=4432 RepID=A0A1U8A0K2_NELNU|nr:PREDICTED: protein RTF1 homolog [Nelumbo nucifera]